jgi:DnaK suppressor protein
MTKAERTRGTAKAKPVARVITRSMKKSKPVAAQSKASLVKTPAGKPATNKPATGKAGAADINKTGGKKPPLLKSVASPAPARPVATKSPDRPTISKLTVAKSSADKATSKPIRLPNGAARPAARSAAPTSPLSSATAPPAHITGKPMNKKARAELSSIVLPAGYRPTDDEPFMNPRQRVYFRNKLQNWKEDIIKQNRETLQILHDDTLQHADLADRATSETDRALELRARDRQRKLIAKIDAALARIEDGSYGYCEETGEPISLKRLDARPIATLSLEAQERHERRERVYRED